MKIQIFVLFFVFLSFQAKSQDTAVVRKRHIATYYHDRFSNRTTTSGEVFSQDKYTAAHLTIPLGTFVKVTHLKNGRFVIVKINDRCPKRGVIDLSEIAAKRLDILDAGAARVTVERLSHEKGYKSWHLQAEAYKLLDRYLH